MDISKLAQKPQLVEVTLDAPDLVERYGEAITFYTWDRITTDQFIKLASIDPDQGTVEMVGILKQFVLNKSGEPVMTEEHALPMDVLLATLESISQRLGKS